MLQFITNESEKHSIVEQVTLAIEGGCRWVQLRMKDATDEEVRKVAEELIPICRDTDTFLVIDDRVELVNELRVSGVHLGKEDMDPLKARELLGPHAIIGITANTAADILKYKGKDVDYVGLGPCRFTTTKKKLAPEIGLDGYKAIVDEVRAEGCQLPIVAIGGLTIDDVEPLMAQGVNGIAMSGSIINADDPKQYIQDVMSKFNR